MESDTVGFVVSDIGRLVGFIHKEDFTSKFK